MLLLKNVSLPHKICPWCKMAGHSSIWQSCNFLSLNEIIWVWRKNVIISHIKHLVTDLTQAFKNQQSELHSHQIPCSHCQNFKLALCHFCLRSQTWFPIKTTHLLFNRCMTLFISQNTILYKILANINYKCSSKDKKTAGNVFKIS